MAVRRLGVCIVLFVALAAPVPAAAGTPADQCPDGLEPVGELCAPGVETFAAPPAAESGVPEASPRIRCYGDGSDGPRVQLLYAHPSNRNNLSARDAAMRLRAAQVDAIYDASAAQTGGIRHVRWLTDSQCRLLIDDVTVSADNLSVNDFEDFTEELARQGYNRADRKYLVWVDTGSSNPNSCSGLGTFMPDETPGQDNTNNTITGYARIDETCLNPLFAGDTEAHELLHNFGAVQRGAPHASLHGHCSDDNDLMCYDDDGSGPFTTTLVCTSAANEHRADCNHDDYFRAPSPTSGYLATHWNAANSQWLMATTSDPSPPGSPTVPTAVQGTGHDQRVALSWSPPTNPGETGVTSYHVYRDGQLLRNTDANTLAIDDTTVTNGVTYEYEVSAENASGEGPWSAIVSVTPGLPPHGYTDVDTSDFYDDAVRWAKAEGVVVANFSDGGFHPLDNVNRGQIVNMLWTLMDQPGGSPPHGFPDVPATAFYRAALDWAKAEGLVTGYSRTQDCAPRRPPCYRPKDGVLRGQLINMLWQMVGAPTDYPPFHYTDIPANAPYRAAMQWADANDLLQGNEFGPGGTQAQPKRPAARFEVAWILFNLASDRAAWRNVADPPSHVRF